MTLRRNLLLAAALVAAASLTAPTTRTAAADDDSATTPPGAEAGRRDALKRQIAELNAALTELKAAAEANAAAAEKIRASVAALEARVAALETTPAPPATPPAPPRVPPLPPLPPNFEWTTFSKSRDARVYYVSTSGDDANDGLSPARPKRTPRNVYELLRNGHPDWMLLKRGDVWDGNDGSWPEPKGVAGFLGGGGKSGRSATEPALLGAYGEGPRPVLVSGTFRALDGDRHVAIAGLEFRYGPGAITSFAIQWLEAACEDMLIEDCAISGYVDNIHIVGDTGGTKRSRNVRIRGCVIADAGAQGVLLDAIDGLVIEGCVFDRNGHGPGNAADAFKHNVYLTHKNTGVTFRQTISARASSHGLQQRPGGLTEDCLFLQNPISIFSAGSGAVQHNVVLDGRDLPDQARGMGIWLGYLKTMDVRGNIVAHQREGSDARALQFDLTDPPVVLTVRENIAWDWGSPHPSTDPIALYLPSAPQGTIKVLDNVLGANGGRAAQLDLAYAPAIYTFRGNRFAGDRFFVGGSTITAAAWATLTGDAVAAPPAYTDPGRTIATYMATLGGQPTLEAFMAEARRQSRTNWRPQFSAKHVNNYVREGFGLEPR